MASILDHWLVTQSYFFPRQDPVAGLCVVPMRDGCQLHCAYVRAPHSEPGAPTVLYFHGNGETASDWEPVLGPFFTDCGWSTVFVEYRGYGGSDGVPKLAQMLSDGEDVVQSLGLSPQQVVAFGRSIGSLYAVELARRLPLGGVILDSGIHDLAERLLCRLTPEELGVTDAFFENDIRTHFDQGQKLSQFEGPVLLLHARDDQLVNATHAERNAAACQRPQLKLLPLGGHNNLYSVNRRVYLDSVREFLDFVRLNPRGPE